MILAYLIWGSQKFTGNRDPIYVDPHIQTNHNSISFDSGDQCTYDKSSVPILENIEKSCKLATNLHD